MCIPKSLSVILYILLIFSGCAHKQVSLAPTESSIHVLDLQGKTRSYNDYLGSPTLLILWASWCQECLAELGTLNIASRLLEAQGIKLIAVAIQDDLESVRSLPQVGRAMFPVLLDVKGEFLERYPAEGLPTAYLVDRVGKPVPLVDPEDGRAKMSVVGLRSWQSAAGQRAIMKSWIPSYVE